MLTRILSLTLSLAFTNHLTLTGPNFPMKITKMLPKFAGQCYSKAKTKVKNEGCLKYLPERTWWDKVCQRNLLQKVHLKVSGNNFREIYEIYLKEK